MESVRPTEVEFDAPGRRHWLVAVGGQTATGVRTTVSIPLLVMNAPEPGPTLLLTGGVHGNEYEGPAALLGLFADDRLRIDRGRLIVAPTVNPVALEARLRRSPDDGLDLNRSFPGDANGTISQAIAAFMAESLVPHADIVFDLHAGGEDSQIIPSAMIHYVEGAALLEQTLELARVTAVPAVLVIDERNQGLFDTYVERQGIPFICMELGGAGMLTAETLRFADDTIQRLLQHLEFIPAADKAPFSGWHDWDAQKVLATPDEDVLPTAPMPGFFRPGIEIGQALVRGDVLGEIYSTDAPWRAPVAVAATCDGVVYSRHTGGYVSAGEVLAIVGEDVSDPDPLATLLQTVPASRRLGPHS